VGGKFFNGSGWGGGSVGVGNSLSPAGESLGKVGDFVLNVVSPDWFFKLNMVSPAIDGGQSIAVEK